ncbi:MAG: 3-dehydroquinate synthase [Bacteroidales bacterium]|nr:3-dehydroquinate synthase [Bacteroidales bacterium]
MESCAGKDWSRVFLLVDSNTRRHCLPLVGQMEWLGAARVIGMQAGEDHKNLETCVSIWNQLSEAGAGRDALLINLGGGVVCDTGGFAASAYKRGIPFINIPTSLLAMVDAALGGKVGVDHMHLKNQIGLFSVPRCVVINPVFLGTLPEEHLDSGYAEVLKHGLIADAEYWEHWKDRRPAALREWEVLIRGSVEIKERIVRMDPYESGPRKALNFGHTFGHAIESLWLSKTGNPLHHGRAVAAGMICETWLSHQKAGLPAEELEGIVTVLHREFQPVPLHGDDLDRLLILMDQDKKNRGGEVRFTLIRRIGSCETDRTCHRSLVAESFEYYLKLKGNA